MEKKRRKIKISSPYLPLTDGTLKGVEGEFLSFI